MKTKLILAIALTLVSVLSVTGCMIDPPSDGSFPKPDTATTKDGTFPNMENLRAVAPGQTKHQIYELLGPPHFHEAVFHVREWNYLFHLRGADRTVTCQYQIRFDDHSRVSETRWSDHACEALVGVKTAGEEGARSSPAL
jgi:outer membrane protein assembly factor BamE (lipoprotein component of BamABCDE complex)